MNIARIILSPVLALIIGIFFLGLARKVIARIQWRYGPPITQPIIDIIRLFNQRSVSHGHLFKLGIVLSLAGSVVVILFLPWGRICSLGGSGGILVILYLMLLAPLGIALSGGEAANPNVSIGISRKLILALGYEVPLLLILLAVMNYYETISLVTIVERQQSASWSLFSLPLLLSGIAYLLILPAILGFRPFEVIQAPQEISSGPMVEYGGQFLALAQIQHALNFFIGIALFVDLFLGGGGNPAIFFAKMLVMFMIIISINAVFPRFRIEQAVKYLWRWPTLLALIGLIVSMIT
ncbi:MAG: NADH-quinone oxidoreductase subunit H [Candidatus Euphemobacter frigidus]|nr:NADH-quinone oxidoreductase subunit H [Candidatus Euphemobacter frigidus]